MNGDTEYDDPGDAELDPDGVVEPLYPSVSDWVSGFFARTVVRRDNNDFRWCPSWWEHPEVAIRLTGLWTSWEAARVTGSATDVNTWWLQELGPHLRDITAGDGPMFACSQHEGHRGSRGLTVDPPPPGTFGPP